MVAIVGLAVVATATAQPRPADSTLSDAAPASDAGLTRSPSLIDLPMQPLAVAPEDSKAPEESAAEEEAAPPPPPKPKPPKPIVHTVAAGETIRMLAARYGLEPLTILAANHLRNPDVLQVDQDLVILPTDGVLYTLQPGESIRRVAERFGVEIAAIVKANDLEPDPDMVQPGTDLVVPGATPVLPAPSRTTSVAQNGESQLQAAAVGNPIPIDPGTAARAAPSARTYEVQPGDTLRSIADTFGVDVDTILSSNGVADADSIKPGSELRILPVKGLEYTVQPSETLADIAWKYQIDLGVLLDYNDLNDVDMIRVGAKLVVPGGKLRPEPSPPPRPAVVEAPTPAPAPVIAAPAPAPAPAPKPAAPAPAPKPAAPAPAPAPKPAAPAPAPKPAAPAPAPAARVAGAGGGALVANAMKYVGYRYVFGGTSPAGFDCSGFVYYVHNVSGAPVGRGMWQQYNGGARIPISQLQPGDTVFFANTYMPGLSHNGIYIGNGQFIHANDERSGVTISSISTAYWTSHYVGATRLWN